MSSKYNEQAREYVKQALQEDVAGNYGKAYILYVNSLKCFRAHLAREKNQKIRQLISKQCLVYLRRVREIRAIIDNKEKRRAQKHNVVSVSPTKEKGNITGHNQEATEEERKVRLRSFLASSIVQENHKLKWDDVAGLDSVKNALHEAIVLPVMFPQFFSGNRRPWNAFLLYGPPGTGKSYLAKAVATEVESTFFSVSSSDLVSKWMGESEKLVSSIFQMARENAPSVIFIDEIDSLCGQRGEGNESEASRRIKTEFLVQMQGVGNNNERVLILAATNTPYSLDQAIRRRFDKRIYIPLPDSKARQHIFKVHLGDTPHNLSERDFERLAQKTEGFSGSDIATCVKEVLFEPIRKTQNAKFFVQDSENMWNSCESHRSGATRITLEELDTRGLGSKVVLPPITRSDFNKALAKQKPTVSKADLEVYERFTQEFGERACCMQEFEDSAISATVSEDELWEQVAEELDENADCVPETEPQKDENWNMRLILNVGVAAFVFLSAVYLFFR